MSSTDNRFSQLHQQVNKLSKGKAPYASTSTSQADPVCVGEGNAEPEPVTPMDSSIPDLAAILKVLKVDVPRLMDKMSITGFIQ